MTLRRAALVLPLIMLASACQPTSGTGSHSAQGGNSRQHKVEIIVTATIGGRPETLLPLHFHADVTIPDTRPGAHHGSVRHGISVRSGHPYPDRWNGYTHAIPTIFYYNPESGPTTFTLGATLDASAIVHMPDHIQVVLTCTVHKDGELIHLLDERSHVWEAITVSQAKTGAIKSIGVLCIWVDR